MENKLYLFDEVVSFIKQGFVLSLAGDERVLKKLPSGNWIAGTIPYFMNNNGGEFNQEQIFVNKIDVYNNDFRIEIYDEDTISNLIDNSYANGYTLLILPAFQKIHEAYSLIAENFDGLYNNPVVGWIAGMDLNSSDVPKIFSGLTGKMYENKGVAIHVGLPDDMFAQLDIVNIFETNSDSDEIKFYNNSLEVSNCIVNGKDTNLAAYIEEKNIDVKLPLIADYSGAAINVSIKEIDADNGKVSFFAPVFQSKTYKFASPLKSYIDEFENKTKDLSNENAFSCNCVLNFLYGELEGKLINNAQGPVTFGEIAYQLLNQTLVVLTVDKI